MYFEDYEIGRVYKDIEPVSFTEEELIWAGKNYDPRDIHIDRQAAKQSSFGEIISPGSYSNMVFWGQWVKTGIDKKGMIAGMGIVSASWLRPVFADTPYRIEVEVVDKKVYKEGESGEVTFEMRVYDPEEKLVSVYSPKGLVAFRSK